MDITNANTVAEAIAAHRLAVDLDEACFSDAHELIDGTQDESNARLAICNALLRQIAEAPCRSVSEVRTKIDYLLNGTLGNRPPNIDAILGFEEENVDLYADDNPLKNFLRSLLIDLKPFDSAA